MTCLAWQAFHVTFLIDRSWSSLIKAGQDLSSRLKIKLFLISSAAERIVFDKTPRHTLACIGIRLAQPHFANVTL